MRKLLCCLFLIVTVIVRGADDHVVNVASEDVEMNVAIDAARRALPVFWKAFEQPAADEVGFFLKLAITGGKETEHFWMREIQKGKDRISGIVDNDPELVSNVKLGQRIAIDPKNISDWKFSKAGVTKGGYTILVLLKRIPKEEAVEIKKQLGWK